MNNNELDLVERLAERLNKLSIFSPVEIGILDADNSVAITTLPGGFERPFYHGESIKTQNVQITAKHHDQQVVFNTLNKIARYLENITDLDSENDSYVFLSVNEVSMPALVAISDNVQYLYEITLSIDIII